MNLARYNQVDMKNILGGLVVGGLASAAALGTGIVAYGWALGDVPKYALSEAMHGLVGPVSLLAGAAVLLLLARFTLLAWLVSLFVVPLPMLGVVLFEVTEYPTSHNLIPFELVLLFAASVILHLPALLFSTLPLLRSKRPR